MPVFAIIFFGDERADVMQRLYDYYPNFYRLDETTSFLKSGEDVDTIAIKLGLKDHTPTAISEVPACIFQRLKSMWDVPRCLLLNGSRKQNLIPT